MWVRIISMACAICAAGSAAAIPPNATYYSACEAPGVPAAGAAVADLTFPQVCFDGACCQLSDPTRLRGLERQFLYDAACEDAQGAAFSTRIFFGEGPTENSLVIVMRDRAETLFACIPPPLEDA